MKLWRGLPLLLLIMLPHPALAHGLVGNDLMAGLAHPVGGWDHLLAMVAVGIISTKIGDGLSGECRCCFCWAWPPVMAWACSK